MPIWKTLIRYCSWFLPTCLSAKWYWQSFLHRSRSSVRLPSSGHAWPRLTRSLPSVRHCMMFSCRLAGSSVSFMPVEVGWRRRKKKKNGFIFLKSQVLLPIRREPNCQKLELLTLLIWMLSSCCCHCMMFSMRCTQMLMLPTSTDLPMSWTRLHSDTWSIWSSSLMGRMFCWSSSTEENVKI